MWTDDGGGVEPDITILVGPNQKVYHAYKVDLVRASSDFFGAALNGTNVIQLPEDKVSTEQWECFVPFIQPSQGGDTTPQITVENVEILLPVFHFLGMKSRLEDCDGLINEIVRSDSSGGRAISDRHIHDFWKNNTNNRRDTFQKLVKFHCLAFRFNLLSSRNTTTPAMVGFLTFLQHTVDLFDLQTIQKLLATVDLFQLSDTDGTCDNLQLKFIELFHSHTSTIPTGLDEQSLSLLVQAYLKHKAVDARLQISERRAGAFGTIMREIIHTLPDELFYRMPHQRTNSAPLVESTARLCLQQVLFDRVRNDDTLHDAFERLDVRVPLRYDNPQMSNEDSAMQNAYHLIKSQHGHAPVGMRDILGYVLPRLPADVNNDEKARLIIVVLNELVNGNRIQRINQNEYAYREP